MGAHAKDDPCMGTPGEAWGGRQGHLTRALQLLLSSLAGAGGAPHHYRPTRGRRKTFRLSVPSSMPEAVVRSEGSVRAVCVEVEGPVGAVESLVFPRCAQ